MYILQIFIDNEWVDQDYFEQYEAAKVAQDFYKHDYKHLQTRIVKEEMEDGEVNSFIIAKYFDDKPAVYAGFYEKKVVVWFSCDLDDAVKFSTFEEAQIAMKKLQSYFTDAIDGLFVINTKEWEESK